ncbi:OmpA family protein [Lysobacter antibioticus]|uniref:OmpA family protein n=1 Tax=Lysobacter antibioticus TaxID=84531 RepID=UPI0024AFDD6E|nr:OmpA family protein [Lysobacter antibioticus]
MPLLPVSAVGESARHGAADSAAVASAAVKGEDVIDDQSFFEVADYKHEAKLYFDVGTAQLPANIADDLKGVLLVLNAHQDKKLRISGFHDETGSAAANAEVSKQRAQAVQQWFESQGIAAERIVLDKPAVTTGDGKPEEARRVEVKVE